MEKQSQRSWLQDVSIAGTKTRYGGTLIKVVNSNLLLERVDVFSSEMFNKHGGIHLAFSHLDMHDCRFDMGQPPEWYKKPVVPEIPGDLQGGFLYVGSNSSVTSRNNVYRKGRAVVGGCVAFQGESRGTFTNDTFEHCSAVQGGAIYGQDFADITVAGSTFKNNVAFSGQGENLFL